MGASTGGRLEEFGALASTVLYVVLYQLRGRAFGTSRAALASESNVCLRQVGRSTVSEMIALAYWEGAWTVLFLNRFVIRRGQRGCLPMGDGRPWERYHLECCP